MIRRRRDQEKLPPEVERGDVVGVDDPLTADEDLMPRLNPRSVYWGIVGIGALIVVLAIGFSLWKHAKNEYQEKRSEDIAFYDALASSERDFVRSCQVESGALLQKPVVDGNASVVPYFANLAVVGLLQGEPSQEDIGCAKRYLAWYGEEMNEGGDLGLPKGVVPDLTIEMDEGKVKAVFTEHPDSWDSYAATYLMALTAFHDAGGSDNFVNAYYEQAREAISIIYRLQGKDGLTRVSDTDNTRYLMDNLEVLAGLYGAMELYDKVWQPNAADDTSLAPRLSEERSKLDEVVDELLNGILFQLWDEQDGVWYVGLDHAGDPIPFEGWDQFYPSAVAQLYPIMFAQLTDAEIAGVPQSTADATLRDSQHLYQRFCAAFPWQDLDHANEKDGHYWPSVAWAAARMGDEGRARTFLENYQEATEANDHGSPLYVGDAGWAARTAAYLAHQTSEEVR